MAGPRNIDGVQLRDRAYAMLHQALTRHEIPDGQRLRELDWTARLGVNRVAFREACARLCVEGLVVEGDRRGYFVPSPRPEDAREAFEIRVMLETGAVERICHLGLNRPENLRLLTIACDDLERLVRRGCVEHLPEFDHRFHEGIVNMAANNRLSRLYGFVPSIAFAIPAGGSQEWLSVGQTMLKQHRSIVAAIRRRRTADAQRLLRSHLGVHTPALGVSGMGVA